MLQVVLKPPGDPRAAGESVADNGPVAGGVAGDVVVDDVEGDQYGSTMVSHSCPGFPTPVRGLVPASSDSIRMQRRSHGSLIRSSQGSQM